MEPAFLILSGVTSRYLLSEGQVQEALFMNSHTGEEFTLGLVEGQYEALLDILRANNGDLSAVQDTEAAIPRRESQPDSIVAAGRSSEQGPRAIPAHTARPAESEKRAWSAEEDGVEFDYEDPEDQVVQASEDEVRTLLAGRL
jgi:hypothetical protein